MKEDLLHYAWRLKKVDVKKLVTTKGVPVRVLEFGVLNSHAGADFWNAKIRIGNTLWVGNVEMHVKSSDWIRHGHSNDRAYDNVILHVVWEEDVPIYRENGRRIPCIELKGKIPSSISTQYLRLQHNEKRIPCEGLLDGISDFQWKMWQQRLIVERMEKKTRPIHDQMERTQNHWEEVFYRMLAQNFGTKINAVPFERLARSIPLVVLYKHRNHLFQLEALLFGQAGMLDRVFSDDYPKRLQKEYQFLKTKHQLQPIHFSAWKNMRLRPSNFPTVRIAQFAALIHQQPNLLSHLLRTKSIKDITSIFDVQVSDYWLTHYVFDKVSTKRKKGIGEETMRLIIINTLAPFLFYYGKTKDEVKYQEQAFSLLENTRAEKNHIISLWKELGLNVDNASTSQALIQLKNKYCDTKKCLHCVVGCTILGRKNQVQPIALGHT